MNEVTAQPVPTSCTLAQLQAPDGHLMVALSFSTPVGTNVFFLDGASARSLGEKLQTLGSAGDILLPGSSLEQHRQSDPAR